MKNILLILQIIICINFLPSCSNKNKRIKALWDYENSINYQQFSYNEEEKVNKLLNAFFCEEKYNKSDWNSGYSQQCYILRKLYYEEIISRDDFLKRCVKIYERYYENNSSVSFHTVGYAVSLYYLGRKEIANKLFNKILENTSEKNFSTKSDYEIVILVCTKLLNKNMEMKDNVFPNMSDEDIINIFCGN